MLSNRADEIKKAIEKVLKDRDIEQLLEDYRSDPDRNFIQKHAETEITTLGTETTYAAFKYAIILFAAAVLITSIVATTSEAMQKWGYITCVLNLILLLGIAHIFKKDPTENKIAIFKEIIIAIEDEKLVNQISVEENIPPNE